jgi:hypothetical protein
MYDSDSLPLDTVSFAPVKGTIAGQDSDFLHDASGKPVNTLEGS